LRRTYKGYEEVLVPAVKPAAPPPGEHLVRIDELPEWAQLAFGGYATLNRIQSRIFQTAFASNENMLVCAPTGECCSVTFETFGAASCAQARLPCPCCHLCHAYRTWQMADGVHHAPPDFDTPLSSPVTVLCCAVLW
jgi:hypothetical protein